MSRQFSGLIFIVLTFCYISVHAGEKDFWNTKPYTEWNEKEVETLLKRSPWSKSVVIGTSTMGGREAASVGARGGGGFPRGGAIGTEDQEAGGGGGGRRGGGEAAPPMRPVEVLVTWYAQPVRQAMARSIALRNAESRKEEIDRLLNYPEMPYFNILVIGWRGETRGDGGEGVRKLKEETFLERKNKQKINLADIILPKGRGQPLVLLFPKEVDGKPSVTLEDKEVTLRTRVGQSKIRVKFKLADMLIRGEPAL